MSLSTSLSSLLDTLESVQAALNNLPPLTSVEAAVERRAEADRLLAEMAEITDLLDVLAAGHGGRTWH